MAARKKSTKPAEVSVKQDDKKPVPVEVMAQAIVDLAKAMRVLQTGPLKERTIVVLLQDLTGLAQRDIKAVLYGLGQLEAAYLKPAKVQH